MFSAAILILLFVRTSIELESDNVIDVDDILEADFMPGSLLVLENPETVQSFNSTLQAANISGMDGSFNEAYHTMGFHRMKMNEYMCRNFVADEILTSMTLSRMRRRLGGPAEFKTLGNHNRGDTSVNQNLLGDEGSSNYKDWLTKSTTLEDIYRHYETLQHSEDDARDRIDGIDREKNDKDDFNEDYDDQITGYKAHKAHSRPSKVGYTGYGVYDNSGGGGAAGFAGIGTIDASNAAYASPGLGAFAGPALNDGGHGYGGHNFGAVSHSTFSDYTKPKVYEHHHHSNSKDLSDLFEIALTALAFLSFGMFIIEICMCIQAATATTPATMTTAPTATATGTGTGTGREYWSDRTKRDTPTLKQTDNTVLNELSRRVLLSIEAVHIANRDDGVCLRRELCRSNKFSRDLDDKLKIWVPVWSLGMSWLSGRVVSSVPPATTMLDSLKASILGLGKADCDKIYRKCELRKEKEDRRRRRKRSAE